ncbi:MAG: Na+/H+ antiporter NhaA, partial [Streptosporangiaceae bacterium]
MPDDGQLPVAQPFSGRTAWARNVQTPLRRFLRTETGSAAVLLSMAVAALVWVNIDVSSYETVWRARLSAELNGAGVVLDLREWVNSGLMTFFFFVFGLEARREFDMGELRERRRLALPVLAGLGGLVLPVAIYLALNAGRPSAGGWGAAMSTDSAFALGLLALTGPRFPDRVRVFLLSVAVVDDLVSLVVIGTVYTRALALAPLAAAIGIFAAILVLRRARVRQGIIYALLGIAAWVAVLKSGIDPVVVGLVMGLLTYAYPAARTDLERASDAFRSFREQPTPELARSASVGLNTALSPNDRLQQLYHPWTSYVIVPLFALANAGIVISGSFLARAYTSPVTLGILIGYVAGKPAGVTAASWLLTRLSRGRLRPPVGWAAVTGVGSIMGIGFTVSILIATLAFSGIQLQEAKLGILSTVVAAPLITWLVFRATTLLPRRLQVRAVLGTAETITDLGAPVDPDRDHIRGPAHAPVTLVEYGDFECPYCGQAEPVIRELLAGHGNVRYVWRHLPLGDVHPHAQLAAEASEAAADQGAFWEMHDLLLAHQGDLLMRDLVRYAGSTGIDTTRFRDHLARRAGAARVAEDVDSADLSGVSGTPTFFVNDLRHYGAYDIGAL